MAAMRPPQPEAPVPVLTEDQPAEPVDRPQRRHDPLGRVPVVADLPGRSACLASTRTNSDTPCHVLVR